MRIMGVDPSISCTGVSLPDGTTLAVKPRTKGDERLKEITDHLSHIVLSREPDLVVMEGLFGLYKGEAGRIIPMLHGALRLKLLTLSVPYVVLNPTSLKRFATGKTSGANKTDMALAALKRLGREYATDDECDADWLRIAGRFAYGLSEYLNVPQAAGGRMLLTMPLAQVAALKRTLGPKGVPVPWPVVGQWTPWPDAPVREVQEHDPGKAVLCPACAVEGRAVCG